MPPPSRRLKIELPTPETGDTMTSKTEPAAPALPETVTLSREQFAQLLAHGSSAPTPAAAPAHDGYAYEEHLCGAPYKRSGQLVGGCNMPATHTGEGRAAVEHTIYATDENGEIIGIGSGNDYRARVLVQWNALFRGEGRVRPGLAEGVNDGGDLCAHGCFPFGWQLGAASQSCEHGTFKR